MSAYLEVQAEVTKTAAFNGAAVDVDTLSADWVMYLEVSNLSAASGTPSVSFVVQYSEDATPFATNTYQGPNFQIEGSLVSANGQEPRQTIFRKSDFPKLPFGVTNGAIRLRLDNIDGTTPTCTYKAWLVTNG